MWDNTFIGVVLHKSTVRDNAAELITEDGKMREVPSWVFSLVLLFTRADEYGLMQSSELLNREEAQGSAASRFLVHP